jgi:hypothetical protein
LTAKDAKIAEKKMAFHGVDWILVLLRIIRQLSPQRPWRDSTEHEVDLYRRPGAWRVTFWKKLNGIVKIN